MVERKVNKRSNGGATGRAKPVVAKAGFTKAKRRYGCGGKLK